MNYFCRAKNSLPREARTPEFYIDPANTESTLQEPLNPSIPTIIVYPAI